jgi:hypothetical protein
MGIELIQWVYHDSQRLDDAFEAFPILSRLLA